MSGALAKPPAEVPADARAAVAYAKSLSQAFRAVAGAVAPAVVSIETVVNRPVTRIGGRPMANFVTSPPIQGQGTGFVVDEDGYILTNCHVVGGKLRGATPELIEVNVKFADGRRVPARIVGWDYETDIAVLKVELTDLTPLAFGDSDAAQVGDWVIALGSPFGLNDSVTAGIISAKGRQVGLSPLESYLQTDATINPGNSGGPLVDMDGRVVGINTAIESRSGGSDGIGFAIPSNMAKMVFDAIVSGTTPARGYLGVEMQPLDADLAASFGFRGRGVLVTRVENGSPADQAGVQAGDIITRINGKEAPTRMVVQSLIKTCPPGSTCTVEVVRDGESYKFTTTLGDFAVAMASISTAAPPRVSAPEPDTPPAATAALSLGLTVADIDPVLAKERGITDLKGVLVTDVQQTSLGARAGIRPGDIVRRIGDALVTKAEHFDELVARALRTNRSVRLMVERQGEVRFVLLRRA